jgi:hypothetical protein
MATTEQDRATIDRDIQFRHALDHVVAAACRLAASRDRRVFEAIERVESACAQLRVLLRRIDDHVEAP